MLATLWDGGNVRSCHTRPYVRRPPLPRTLRFQKNIPRGRRAVTQSQTVLRRVGRGGVRALRRTSLDLRSDAHNRVPRRPGVYPGA